jgi:hypothetical protein
MTGPPGFITWVPQVHHHIVSPDAHTGLVLRGTSGHQAHSPRSEKQQLHRRDNADEYDKDP